LNDVPLQISLKHPCIFSKRNKSAVSCCACCAFKPIRLASSDISERACFTEIEPSFIPFSNVVVKLAPNAFFKASETPLVCSFTDNANSFIASGSLSW
jgi:hypothetical protein